MANLKPGAEPVRTVSREVYAFKDLDGKAREKALEWLQECATSDGCLDSWADCIGTDLEVYGFTLDTDQPLTYSLGYCQGDGAAFTGTVQIVDLLEALSPKDGKPCPVEQHAPKGDLPTLTPEALADLSAFVDLCDGYACRLDVEVPNRYHIAKATLESNWDLPEPGTDEAAALARKPNPTDEEIAQAARDLEARVLDSLEELVRDLCAFIEKSGYDELEHLTDEEQCAEMAEANGYTFTEDGRRYG